MTRTIEENIERANRLYQAEAFAHKHPTLTLAAPDGLAANRHAAMAFRSLRGLNAGQQSIVDAALTVLDAAIAKAEGKS